MALAKLNAHNKIVSQDTEIDFELIANMNDLYFELSYDFFLQASLAYWFAETDFTYSNKGTIKINANSTDKLKVLFDLLKLSDFDISSTIKDYSGDYFSNFKSLFPSISGQEFLTPHTICSNCLNMRSNYLDSIMIHLILIRFR